MFIEIPIVAASYFIGQFLLIEPILSFKRVFTIEIDNCYTSS